MDMDPSDIINNSICLHCVHKLTRTIELVTQEDKEYYMDLVGIDNIEDYDFFIEQHKCLITDEDLDGIIHDCSHYMPTTKNSLIREWRY